MPGNAVHPIARDKICSIACASKDSSLYMRALDNSALLSSNAGFSVVAPIKITVPSSTNGKNASCWLLLKRCTSSTNSTVTRPWDLSCCASSIADRISFTPLSTAERLIQWASLTSATRRASVVLPVPGGPQKIKEWSRPDSIITRSGFPSRSRCSCPKMSPSDLGRTLAASGT